ncbi:MAG TPA: ABC transporter ATP-binding protein [Acidimicrobiales bacterium]
MANSIEIEGVSKRFRLTTERHSSLKERVIHRGRRSESEDFWALSDIAFDVAGGTTVGLLGHNGSGKSTLLKCIGSILRPTTGVIRTWGRMASLLELGAGFHPDLTGRENIFLNASILGLSKKETEALFDEIVAFSELERFIDQQVKHYSSGMYVRLGFSVATAVDPEILLVDEVLAVGDEAFQRKCLDRIKRFQREGRTIVFVTHAADLVRQICDRVVVLDHGKQIVHAPPAEAVRVFREGLYRLNEAGEEGEGHLDSRGFGKRIRVRTVNVDYADPSRRYVVSGEPVTVRIGFEAFEPMDDVIVALAIMTTDGQVVTGTSNAVLHEDFPVLDGVGELSFQFESLSMLAGHYPMTIAVHSRDGGDMYEWRDGIDHLDVVNTDGNFAWGVLDAPVHIDLSQVRAEPVRGVG